MVIYLSFIIEKFNTPFVFILRSFWKKSKCFTPKLLKLCQTGIFLQIACFTWILRPECIKNTNFVAYLTNSENNIFVHFTFKSTKTGSNILKNVIFTKFCIRTIKNDNIWAFTTKNHIKLTKYTFLRKCDAILESLLPKMLPLPDLIFVRFFEKIPIFRYFPP